MVQKSAIGVPAPATVGTQLPTPKVVSLREIPAKVNVGQTLNYAGEQRNRPMVGDAEGAICAMSSRCTTVGSAIIALSPTGVYARGGKRFPAAPAKGAT
eukprot:6208049-Pleurochrysis_carterae.AAC.3